MLLSHSPKESILYNPLFTSSDLFDIIIFWFIEAALYISDLKQLYIIKFSLFKML